jgi:hypothetical protein
MDDPLKKAKEKAAALVQQATRTLLFRNQHQEFSRRPAISDCLRCACQSDPKNRAAHRQNGQPRHYNNSVPLVRC